jgi:hypothetical protein
MADTLISEASSTDKAPRSWGRHSFYISDQMAAAAHRLSEAEERKTGRQVGAGQIVDRAMRRYLADVLTPEELAQLVSGRVAETGK